MKSVKKKKKKKKERKELVGRSERGSAAQGLICGTVSDSERRTAAVGAHDGGSGRVGLSQCRGWSVDLWSWVWCLG
jgi:hypothetical protein